MSFWDTLLTVGGDIGGSFIGDPSLGNQTDMMVNAFEGNGGAPPGTITGYTASGQPIYANGPPPGVAGAAAGGGAAANAALGAQQTALTANEQNIQGENNLQSQTNQQRQNALRDLALMSYVDNPRSSPFDPAGAPKFDPAFTSTLGTLGKQAQGILANPAPTPSYTPLPLNASDFAKATGTNPSPLATIGAGLTAATGALTRNGQQPSGPSTGGTAPDPNFVPSGPADPNAPGGGVGGVDPSTGLPWGWTTPQMPQATFSPMPFDPSSMDPGAVSGDFGSGGMYD